MNKQLQAIYTELTEQKPTDDTQKHKKTKYMRYERGQR